MGSTEILSCRAPVSSDFAVVTVVPEESCEANGDHDARIPFRIYHFLAIIDFIIMQVSIYFA